MVRKIIKDIKSNEPSGAYFDAAHMAVRIFLFIFICCISPFLVLMDMNYYIFSLNNRVLGHKF